MAFFDRKGSVPSGVDEANLAIVGEVELNMIAVVPWVGGCNHGKYGRVIYFANALELVA